MSTDPKDTAPEALADDDVDQAHGAGPNDSLPYYTGSVSKVDWTVGHANGPYELKGSEYVINYMCDSRDPEKDEPAPVAGRFDPVAKP